ncbi:hypothetical protein XELAEV_18002708mg [Xenopus laevis]|uniref:Coronin n=1 Tax=Xenopus laevis TaxID=8355 RepID=A0A974GY98_XENLA|nr:hypothetical protein XELAEV_18002708mg [Xenopus laevis]
MTNQTRQTLANCLLSVPGCDNVIMIWDVGAGQGVISIDETHTDLIYSVAWNPSGSLLCTSCKDKKIRIIEPRSGNIQVVSLLVPPTCTRALFIWDFSSSM